MIKAPRDPRDCNKWSQKSPSLPLRCTVITKLLSKDFVQHLDDFAWVYVYENFTCDVTRDKHQQKQALLACLPFHAWMRCAFTWTFWILFSSGVCWFRYFDPISGSIKLDGQDLRTLTLTSFRSTMAVVPQVFPIAWVFLRHMKATQTCNRTQYHQVDLKISHLIYNAMSTFCSHPYGDYRNIQQPGTSGYCIEVTSRILYWDLCAYKSFSTARDATTPQSSLLRGAHFQAAQIQERQACVTNFDMASWSEKGLTYLQHSWLLYLKVWAHPNYEINLIMILRAGHSLVQQHHPWEHKVPILLLIIWTFALFVAMQKANHQS